MLNFIKTTNDVMLKEIPNVLIHKVEYSHGEGCIDVYVEFYDLDFNILAFNFEQNDIDIQMSEIDLLGLEFTEYIRKHVKPVFKNKINE